MSRVGVTLPFDGLELHEHRDALRTLAAAGYREVSTGEVNGVDALTPLILFSAWEPELALSCAVVSAFTRGPGLLAMTAAAFAEAAPGRARFGIGAGSDRIVEAWNGVPFRKPYARVEATLRFLRQALRDGRVDDEVGAPLGSKGFRLARIPSTPPALILAALGPKMQRLAAAQADCVALNFLGAGDMERIRAEAASVTREVDAPLEIETRVFVIPGSDAASEEAARRMTAAYLTVPVYTSFQVWLGRGGALGEMLDAWAAGDRKKAVTAVPDEVVSELFVTGSPADCAVGIQRYLDAGVDVATIGLLPPHGADFPVDEQLRFLSDLGGHLHQPTTARAGRA
jgi:probable F420-dependent oxidoreductase